jgi:hypothetical protein
MSKIKIIFWPTVVRFENNESEPILPNDANDHRKVRGSLAVPVWPVARSLVDNTAFTYRLQL